MDDALARTGPRTPEESGDFPSAPPFAHKRHSAIRFGQNPRRSKSNRSTAWLTGTGRGIDFGDGIRRHPTQLHEIGFATLLACGLTR
ncbi:MAG TPA: hypothetical protein PK752_17445 [Accumulibacter sp.]|uniref:hypothetical protein n=1 Tax=Accumulibacter sp. TaxID=2053492 RepID=UPI002C67886C|nr:hypothetical protein [Accumulibacter sp.]HRD90023.1 hypothetical protein [Accumulibacter sp.]